MRVAQKVSPRAEKTRPVTPGRLILCRRRKTIRAKPDKSEPDRKPRGHLEPAG